MATNFGDTIMEGSIEPTARVQQPVQDNSGAVLAESLGGAARAVGAIAGSIFKQGQDDANNKILVDYEMRNLDYAEAVAQGQMEPNEFRIKAMALRREFLSRAPALQNDFDKIYSSLVNSNGLGHVGITGNEEDVREKAMADAAYAAGFPSVETYRQSLVDGQAVVESTRRLTMLQNEGATITQTQMNQHLSTITKWADNAFPVAQRQINEAMTAIQNNPSDKQATVENLNFVIGSQIAQIQQMGGPADSTYITAPIQGLLDTFNKFSQGTITATMLENELKTTQLKYDLMYATDPTYASKIAVSRLLSSVGMEQQGYQMWDANSVKALVDLIDGKGNPLNGEEGTQRSIENLTLKAGSITPETDTEEIAEIRTGIEQLIDSVYRNERSVEDDPTAYNVAVHSLGSPEIAGFISQHGISPRYAQQVAGIFKERYEQELLPVVNRTWTEPVPLVTPSTISTGDPNAVVGGMQNIPMNQLLEPRWNGNAVEFVPVDEYANNPRVIQLAQDVTSGDNSIGVPVNAMINAQSLLTGVDAKTIYEEDFAGRFFGAGEEGESDEESESSISPEDDAQLDLSSFQPDELVSPVQVASLGNVSLNDGEFIEPTSNPSVDPEVLRKFEGRRIPVSIRNNNMGAVSITGSIPDSWAAKQPGFVGVTPRPANEGGYYAKYATPEHGVAAASKLLELYGKRGVDSPAAIVRKWSVDRSAHNSYQNTLVRYLKEAGYNADANTALDLNDPSIRMAILKAKSAHESGAGRPVYNDRVFRAGVGMGV